jgi:hypothetical protein
MTLARHNSLYTKKTFKPGLGLSGRVVNVNFYPHRYPSSVLCYDGNI